MEQIYLNTASCGLVAPATLAAANKLYADLGVNGSKYSEQWRMNDEGRIRQVIADFIGAPAGNVAMVPNFTWALNALVQSLKGTERVLLYKNDYPSVLEPFRINGFDITWIDAPGGFHMEMDKVRDAITGNKVDIVLLSHVQWGSGYSIDLKEIGSLCKEYGVIFIVDATQSLGANQIDLSEVHADVFAASNYKWMNGGFGTGILYVSDSFLERYKPVVGGHNSYKMVGDSWIYTPSALSYEPGHPNMYGLTLLEAAIAQKNEIGMQAIAAHDRRLTALFLAGIADLPVNILGGYTMENRSPIVVMKDEDGLGDWIKQQNIVITQRNGLLRVSTHFYNTQEEVEILVNCIAQKFS